MKKKNIIVYHGFMCNGKTTLINNKLKNNNNAILLKDKSQYYVNLHYENDSMVYDIQKTILLSAVNYFLNLFESIIPNIRQDIIYLDRDLYDAVIYTLMIFENTPEIQKIKKFIDIVINKYKTLQTKYNVKHILLTDIVDPDNCIKTKKRLLAIKQIKRARNIDIENKIQTDKDLLLYYNQKYIEYYNKLL